ncbi:ComEC family competence protein [Spirosoma sp. KCTC 42546]|uniref:ComEC/Rec2 family competence protein n=1 Tax=Spirosoma sp. KCTC 42546 TaxID=2520506 RepID=UPI00115A9D6F|nr:ComEC/Rec2 family competence protein [Spirosoma sp. KCTC 42546]QDK79849.1 ComEC family competence protein [Spirosoma sp. KCTC 42546]
MKGQPFVRYVAALIAGISLYVFLPNWPMLPIWGLVIGLGLFISGFFRTVGNIGRPIQSWAGIGGLLILAGLGWAITYQRTASNRPDNISHLADTLQAYEGIVSAQPEERAKTYRVELEIRQATFGRAIVHQVVLDQQPIARSSQSTTTSWKPVSGRVIVYLDKADQPMPRYGEVWLVSGSPRPIDPPLNPGEFNYKRYLSYRNIYHQQYLRPFQRQILGLDPPNRITQLATRVNRWADSVFTHQVGARAEYGIVNAMILGSRDDLDTELYRAYSAAGAVHILSVSGLHVGILFQVLTVLLGFLAKRRYGKLLMAGLQLAILWFYALVTGFSPPVLRSAAMFTMVILANASGRQQQIPNTLGASAFFILCFDPYALFSAGFQLSYLAVAGISAWQSSLYQSITFRYKWANKLWELTAVALVAQLITFPLGVFYFHQFPTYFLVANPIVIVMSEILLPLAMATLACSWVPYLNDTVGWLLQKTAWLLNYAVTKTGQLPGAAWDGLWLSPIAMLLIYTVILCGAALLLTRNRVYVWATAAAAVLLAMITGWEEYSQQNQQQVAVHFLPHRTAVSLTYGHRSTLLTDLDTNDTRSFDFYLKNTFGQWGVKELTIAHVKRSDNAVDSLTDIPYYYRTPAYALWVWHGKTLLLVNKLSGQNRWRLPAVVDYLIIRRNALQHWDQLNGRVVARHIIFDDSNKTPLTDKLLGEARQRGIACYSVRQMGAYVADLE